MMFTQKRRGWWLPASALPIVLILSACSAVAEDAAPDEVGTTAATELVVGSLYEHDGFDPLNPLSASANGERLVPVFDTLLRVGTDGDVIPFLASGMESDDGATWTMTLRDGVTFTDGTPFDAEAVIFNVERHRAKDSPSSSKFLLANLTTMTAPDATTVVFTLSQPNYSFPYLFTASGAVGLIGSPTALAADAEAFNRSPVGAGPFIVQEWVVDDHVTMTRNPNYWGDKPQFETLTYRVLPDPQSRENALVTGQIQAGVIMGNFGAVSQNKDLTINTQGVRGAIALLPNMSAAPLNDQRVREAIQIAFDPKNTNSVMYGTADLWNGERGCIPFGVDTAQCEPSSVKTDVTRASKLIADYVADGNSPAIEILTNSLMTTYSEYVDQVLKSIGLASTIRSVSPSEHIPALYSGDFQLGMWQMTPFDSFYPLGYTVFSSSARNVIKQDSAPFQDALNIGVNAPTIDERNQGLRDMQSQINDQALAIWLSPLPMYMTTRNTVDLGPGYLGGMVFYASEVTLK
ncbi:ABC transporter substrate-binding protein [Glaciibacter psychrotolerans]|uniref:Peptide/nickel transport system substrate-binding protein n=1 Tax=Glaciibacter psychrotolerans TaxID=670054 RepID=A0A7Z0EH08_9MICO|nr:ABC transporter substrate-binding protein [Leifsonia psychrotolerans]NYJ21343.1 peptide/nickel transport system substrate-binding protein [Leifsonia psychrotolerans]